jgi:pimeloyl-ACP methyl ester carboxylesterase
LAAPHLVRKLIVAGARAAEAEPGSDKDSYWPKNSPSMEHVERLRVAKTVEEGRESLKYGLFPDSEQGRAAFDAYWGRITARQAEPPRLDMLSMEPNGDAQFAAIIDAATPQPNAASQRLAELRMPVLVQNGDADVIIPTSMSWDLLKGIDNAQLIIYPRSGHGFLWHYAKRVAEDVNRFLDGADFE